MPNSVYYGDPKSDNRSVDIYDSSTGEKLGTATVPPDKTLDDYKDANGNYDLKGENSWTPAGEGTADPSNDNGSDKSNPAENKNIDPQQPPGQPSPSDIPPAGEDENDPDYAVGEDEPWEDEWNEDDWDNEDEGGEGDEEDDGNGDQGGGEDSGRDGAGAGAGDPNGDPNGQINDDPNGTPSGSPGDGPSPKRQRADEARRRADEARDKSTLGQRVADGIRNLVDAAKGQAADAKVAGDNGGKAGSRANPVAGRNQTGAGVDPPVTFSVKAADPVNLCSGAFETAAVDFVIDSVGPALGIVRHHSSQLYASGLFGNGVECWLDASVRLLGTGSILVRFGDGNGGIFGPTAGGFASPFGSEHRLRRLSRGEFELRYPNGSVSRFASSGQLVRYADLHGNALLVERSANGRIERVTGSFGDRLDIAMNTNGTIGEIVDHAGNRWRYGYDAQGRLVSLHGPATPGNPNGLRARYAYRSGSADPRAAAQIEQVENGAGEVVVRNSYGTSGQALNRVVEQWTGGGRWRFSYTRAVTLPASDPAERQEIAYRTETIDPVGTRIAYAFNAYCALLEQRLLRPGRSSILQQFILDASLRPERVIPARGGEIRYQWLTTADGFDRVNEVRRVSTDPGGSDIVTRMTYDAAGRITGVVAADGGQTDLTLDAAGRTTKIIGPAIPLPGAGAVRPEQRFTYDGRGRVTAMVDVDQVQTRYSYDAAARGLLTELQRNGRVQTSWQYDNIGRIRVLRDAAGANHTVEYDAASNVVRETGPEGGERRYRYDAADRLVASGFMLDGSLVETDYRYDASGRCVEVSTPLDTTRRAVERYSYDPAGRVTAIQPAGSARIETDYEERGLVSELRVAPGTPDAAIERYTYDAAGNLTRRQDRRGKYWYYSYDSLDRLTKFIRPDGVVQTIASDQTGRIVGRQTTNSSGQALHAERFSFDPLGRMTAQDVQLFGVPGAAPRWVGSQFVHDIAGRPVEITDTAGRATQMRWSTANDILSVTDPLANRAEFDWDSAGRLIAMRDIPQTSANAAIETRFTVDSASRVRTISDALGNRETIEYDSAHRVTGILRPDGIREQRQLDLAGRLVSRSIPWGSAGRASFLYEHDEAGRITALIDPDNEITRLKRGPTGTIKEVQGPGGLQTLRLEHDADGLTRRTTDARSVVTDYTRDRLGRLTRRKITKPASVGGIAQEDYQYDDLGRLVAASNANHSYSATYDSLGRILTETTDGATTSYRYGADLLPDRIVCPGGTVLEYSRDALGRVTELRFAPQGAATPAIIGIGWLGSGRISRIDHGNGLATNYSFDRAGRLISLQVMRGATRREQMTLLRDSVSRIAIAHRAGAQLRSYSRDAMGQIVSVRSGSPGNAPVVSSWLPGGSGTQNTLNSRIASNAAAARTVEEIYALTPGGDRTQRTSATASETYVRAAGHRYQQVGNRALAHDAAGNVTNDGQRSYVYDHANRLVRVSDGGGAQLLALTYDPLGRMKTVTDAGGSVAVRHYLGLDVVEEVRGTSTCSYAVAFGIDQSLAMAVGAQIYHLHRDHIWSVIAVSGATGAITERYDYDLFGNLINAENGTGAPLPSAPLAALYQGRPALLEGLIDVRQRVLHAGLGRFLQCDPAGMQADANPYRFALNDPTMFVDPTGEIVFIPILVGLAVGAGISAWANRDKSGADFWVAVGAGALGGAIAGTGLGTVGFIAGGAVTGIITGAYEGGKVGGVKGAVVGGVINGTVGAVAGGVGGVLGARVSTGVTGTLNAALSRGALNFIEKSIGGPMAFQGASYVGTMVGGGAGGALGGLTGGVIQGSGTAFVNGAGAEEIALGGLANGIDGALAGVGPGIVGGVASKGLMQSGFFKSVQGWKGTKITTVFEREGEFYAQNQSGNAKGTTKLSTGAKPDLDGNNLPWAKKVYGDVKNTADIPNFEAQPSKASGIGQLQQIYDAVPLRYDQNSNPTGNKMTLFYRPGVRFPGQEHGLYDAIQDGSLVLKPITQFVFAPPDTAGSIK